MELWVLGSGTATPTAERGPSGLALLFASHFILLDGGSGTLQQMAKLGLDFRQISIITLSHFHPDHVADFVPFLFATNYTVNFIRSLPLHVISPPGLKEFYEQLKGVFGRWIEAQTYSLLSHEAGENHFSLPDGEITTLPMAHAHPSIGFRVHFKGQTLVYSGDTEYCPNIVKLGREADLLILECSFSDDPKNPGHLTPPLAGRIAREASCRKLLLTHFYPVFQGINIRKECQKEFAGEIILAEDGMKITV
jgi:ribonuclease BN (tRNA processing enzyme)